MINVVLLFTTISYIAIFPTLIKLRYSHRDVYRPYKVPFGMAGVWICGVLTTFWAVFASIVGLFPGLGDGQFLNNQGPRRRLWPLARRLHVARVRGDHRHVPRRLPFYWAGAKTRAEMVPGATGLPPEITGDVAPAPAGD